MNAEQMVKTFSDKTTGNTNLVISNTVRVPQGANGTYGESVETAGLECWCVSVVNLANTKRDLSTDESQKDKQHYGPPDPADDEENWDWPYGFS